MEAAAGPVIRWLTGRTSARFAAVGIANTGIDFGVFIGLVAAGMPLVAANFVSTSCGLAFSYFANRRFTFGLRGRHRPAQVVLFVAVTGTGLWLLQPLALIATHAALTPALAPLAIAAAGKTIAILVGMVWNFAGYRLVVFRRSEDHRRPLGSAAALAVAAADAGRRPTPSGRDADG